MNLQLKGKRVLVTGGSKGIGRACAHAFAQEGCDVTIVARDAQSLETTARELQRDTGVDVKWRSTDLARRGAAQALAGLIGAIDILVNNAGAIPGGDLLTVDEDAWRDAWDLKVFGYIDLSRAVYRSMKAQGSGVIVNVVGAAGERLSSSYIAGSTGNAALMAFTRALGGTSHKDGIRVLGVSPGPVATERLVKVYQQRAQVQLGDGNRYPELLKQMAFGRPARPEEIADTVVFAASERSSYTTGVYITIDGGLAAAH